jgi:hypothetical protein
MKSATRHVSKRSYPGEREGRIVARWLNHPERLHTGVDRMARFEALDEAFSRQLRKFLELRKWDNDEKITDLVVQIMIESALEFGKRHIAIRRLMDEIPIRTTLVKVSARRGVVVVNGRESMHVMIAAMNLGRQGFLRRIRRCLRCRKWFYRRFRHQDFCTSRCQEMFWQVQRKADRKKNARKYEAHAKRQEKCTILRKARDHEEQQARLMLNVQKLWP